MHFPTPPLSFSPVFGTIPRMIYTTDAHDHAKPYILVHISNHTVFRVEAWEGMVEEATRMGCPYYVVRKDHLDGRSVSGRCLGMITSSSDAHEIEKLPTLPFPVVNIANHDPLDARLAHVIHDDFAIGRMAARHLIRAGHPDLVVLGWEGLRFSNERVAGFLQAATATGLNAREILLPPHLLVNNSPERILEDFRPILTPEMSALAPDAGCFGVTDRMGHLLLDFMMLHLPERLHTTGVIGAENIEPPRWIPGDRPALTSIQTGNRALGRRALKRIIEIVERPERLTDPPVLRIPPERVIQRASTGGHACAHPLAGRASRWIWEQVERGTAPDLDAVAAYLRMSSRSAERLFNTHHHAGVKAFILGTQLDRACQMLRHSRLDIGEIAAACGFAGQSNFGRVFKLREGRSPRQWRLHAMDHAMACPPTDPAD